MTNHGLIDQAKIAVKLLLEKVEKIATNMRAPNSGHTILNHLTQNENYNFAIFKLRFIKLSQNIL